MPDGTKRKRKWLIRLVVMALVLSAVGAGGWYGLQRAVKISLVAQLNSLGLGTPEIRSVSLSRDGIHASQIRFVSETSPEPTATLDALVIHHSLFELITGSPTYDAIDLVGLNVHVAYPFSADAPALEIDWKSLALPAKKIAITRSAFVLQDSPERTFEIREADLTITANGDKLETRGVIGSMIGGPWKVTGIIEPKNDTLSFEMRTDQLSLVNHRWQKWPFIPAVIEQTVHGDALMKARVSFRSDPQNGFDVTGLANIEHLNLKFPWFDNLPVNIHEGDIEFRNQTVYYKDIVATVDGADQLRGNGETTVDAYPIKVKFEGDFRDLELTSLRKLVAGIPDNVQGKATGDVAGLINIEASTRTVLDIAADAGVQAARYGQIESEKLRNETRIVDLIFDENQYFESVDGHVSVAGMSLSQPIKNIFETFELTELERRLELIGDFVADLEVQLPLATISDLTTWKLDVKGAVAEATICDQPISRVDIEARLNQGELQFRPIHAVPLTIAEANQMLEQAMALPGLEIAVDWPLVELVDDSHGRVQVKGQRVPTGWIRRFTDQQIENATRLPREEIDPDHRWAFEMAGQIDLQTEIEIPVAFPDALMAWKATGSVLDSTVVFDRLALSDLAAKLRLEKGLLSISNANGTFDNGGMVTANGHIDVGQQVDHQMDFTGRRLPFSWATMLAADGSEALKRALVELGIDEAIDSGELGGELSVDLKLSTEPDDVASPWTVRSIIHSERLNIGDAIVTKLRIEGAGNPDLIQIDRFHGELPESGFVEVQGKWVPKSGAADGTVEWEKLPVFWLTQLAKLNWVGVDGRAHGKLSFRSKDISGIDFTREIPVEIDGEISSDPLRIGDLDLWPFSMNVATRDGVVHFENLRTTDEPRAIGLRGELSLSGPHSFVVTGDLRNEQLSSLSPSDSDAGAPTLHTELAGVLSTEFRIDGQLKPFAMRTHGNLNLTALVVAGVPLGDMSATWNHSSTDWSTTSFSAQAIGGSINLSELSNAPQRLQAKMTGVDLVQLNSIVASGIPVSGTLGGSLDLSEWSDRENLSAKLQLNSPAIRSGDVEFRDLTGLAEYRDQTFSYGFDGEWLGSKLAGNGQVESGTSSLRDLKFPVAIRAARLDLQKISAQVKSFRSLQPLSGSLLAIADLELQYGQSLTGIGRLELNDLGWNNKRLVKEASTRIAINNSVIALEDFRGNLEQGSISGRLVIPTNRNAPGSYEFDIRHMDLGELTKIALGVPTDIEGQFSARFNGRWDRLISGQGFVGVQRASIHGLEGQAFRLPARFSFSPHDQAGRIEFRQSTFRLFDGKATASAIVNFGRSLSFDTKVQLANVNTGKLLEAIADMEQSDQGKMSGRLALTGRGVRTMRDVDGTFVGQLTRASAFELPVLQDMARFLSGNNIKTRDYNTDQIDMQLSKGRIEVKRLNFTNSLAKIAIRGNAFLDGRLDLKVAARVDQFGQPTLIEELAGSPLAGFSGSPVTLFVQAAEFLSERVVFLRVNGTFRQPQVRIDTGQQLADEAIRYFLRGSQILPNGFRRND